MQAAASLQRRPDSAAVASIAAINAILIATGKRLPADPAPTPQPKAEPLEELVLELTDLNVHEHEGIRRRPSHQTNCIVRRPSDSRVARPRATMRASPCRFRPCALSRGSGDREQPTAEAVGAERKNRKAPAGATGVGAGDDSITNSTDVAPSPQPKAEPLEELVLELTDLNVHKHEGIRRRRSPSTNGIVHRPFDSRVSRPRATMRASPCHFRPYVLSRGSGDRQ